MIEQSFTALPIMKNILDYIRKYLHRSKRLLGIDYPQFLQLLEQAQLKHTEQQAENPAGAGLDESCCRKGVGL